MHKRKSKAPYIAAVFGGLVILLAAGFGIWLAVTDAAVRVKAPTRPIPNPNAYDYYIDAGDKIVVINDIYNALEKPKSSTLIQKRTIIKTNEPALQALREGFKYDCMSPIDSSMTLIRSGTYTKLRRLANLTSLDCKVYNESGEHWKAIQSCLDGIQLGGDTIKGSEITGFLISQAIQAIAIHEATPDLIDNLNVSEAQSAITRLDKILSRYAPFSEILENEKFSDIQKMTSSTYYATPGARVGTGSKLFMRIILPGHIADWDKAIADTAIPYAQYSKLPTQSGGIIFRMVEPVISKARLRYEYTLCTNQMLLLQLALRSYKATTGAYPSTLSDLAPKYLAKLPTDRFTPTGTYKYKQTAKGYILYSIGPDGKDNAGIPVTVRGTPEPTDRGDIVVEHSK
jgi:hypothetical protein